MQLVSLCPFCGLNVIFWQNRKHERYHAEQVAIVRTLLCDPCFEFHGKMHQVCGKFPACRCACNGWDMLEGGE